MSLSIELELNNLQKVMYANLKTLQDIESGGDAVQAGLAYAAGELSIEASEVAPFLYGVLSSAHRGEVKGKMARVFIDPSVVHPVLGGKPAQYGAELHESGRPWFQWTLERHGERVTKEAGNQITAVLGGYWA